ncbi:beta strand repeat-containing protein [Pseudomonadota bacterium]
MINQGKVRRKELALAIGISLAVGTGTARAEFSANIELSALDGSNGTVLNGVAAEDNAGQSVSAAGDFNGDGIDDLVVGAPYASNGAQYAGKAYVLFGSAQGVPSSPLNLSNSGLVITGANLYDSLGSSVSVAGDINGDGVDDLVIGAANSSLGASYAGATFVVFGNDQVLPSALSVSDLSGSNGFAILGTSVYSSSGTSVSGAGDINGDGFDDLIIGAPYTGNGSVYVVFGSDQAWNATLAVSSLDGSNGFQIDGINQADSLGTSVSAAGDINGDGTDDLIVGATLAGSEGAYAGAAYVIFGNNQPWPVSFDLTTLDGNNGFAIVGLTQGDYAGSAVSTVGDVNGDGIDDVIVGAPQADPNGSQSGASYVVFGSDQGLTHPLNVSALTGSNGFALYGTSAGDNSGSSVASAGDINADGVSDLLIGANLADPHGEASGASYVVFGKQQGQGWPSTVALSSLNGASGFRAKGVSAGDQSGTSVSGAGDVNSDGKVDFVVGAPLADPNGIDSGAAYVVYDATAVSSGDIIFSNGFEQ